MYWNGKNKVPLIDVRLSKILFDKCKFTYYGQLWCYKVNSKSIESETDLVRNHGKAIGIKEEDRYPVRQFVRNMARPLGIMNVGITTRDGTLLDLEIY